MANGNGNSGWLRYLGAITLLGGIAATLILSNFKTDAAYAVRDTVLSNKERIDNISAQFSPMQANITALQSEIRVVDRIDERTLSMQRQIDELFDQQSLILEELRSLRREYALSTGP